MSSEGPPARFWSRRGPILLVLVCQYFQGSSSFPVYFQSSRVFTVQGFGNVPKSWVFASFELIIFQDTPV